MQISVTPDESRLGCYKIEGTIDPLEVMKAEMPDLIYRVGEEVVQRVTKQLLEDYGNQLFAVIRPDVLSEAVSDIMRKRIQEAFEYQKDKKEAMGDSDED